MIFLGYEDTFGFVGCGPRAISCIHVYSLDFLAAFLGVVAIAAGIFAMIRSRAEPLEA